jgi:hypothetical protein
MMFTGEERYEPLIWILDTSYQNGNEFYGMNTGVALTPVTERCFLTMSQALQRYQGSAVTGPVGAGKTETVKVCVQMIYFIVLHLYYFLNYDKL